MTTGTIKDVTILSLFVFILLQGVNTENNFSPQFDYFPTSIYIPETATFGDMIWSCNATDGDDPTTPAGHLRYQFVVSVPKWILDPGYCVMYVNTKLDYETQLLFTLKIIVKDLDPTSPRTSTGTLTIHVIDINDNIPTCEEYSSVLDVPEDQPVNTQIARLICTDKDRNKSSHGRILYKLSDSNSAEVNETFKVDTGDGIVTLKKQLDYETVKFYKLTIDVYDNAGSESLTTTVTYNIQVGDIDDNKPTWSQNPLTVYVNETETKLGDVAFTLTAIDVDKPLTTASTITCGIKTPPVPDWFHIDSHTGAVYVKGILNCNTAPLVTMEVYAYSSNKTTDISVLLVNIRLTEYATLPTAPHLCRVTETTTEITTAATTTAKTTAKTTTTTKATTAAITTATTVATTTATTAATTTASTAAITAAITTATTTASTTATTAATTTASTAATTKATTEATTSATTAATTATTAPDTTVATATTKTTTSTAATTKDKTTATTKATTKAVTKAVTNPITTNSNKPDDSTQSKATEEPNVDEEPDGTGDMFMKGLGIGIGSTLAVVIICILVAVFIYKYRKGPYKSFY